MNPDFIRILETLAKHEVDFLITGGISAVIQGAPVTTFDLDIVHKRSSENVQRLVAALNEMEAHYRTRRDIEILPEVSTLMGPGHHLLMTRFGPLDVLGSIGKGQTFEALVTETEQINLDALSVRVQSLRSLIAVKEEIGMEKDKAVLPILRKTLEERKK